MNKQLSWIIQTLICSGCLLAASLSGCGSDDQPANAPHMPAAKMKAVLRDIHLVDAWTDRQGGPYSRRKDIRDELYDEVLDQHGLDRKTFHQTYQYYLDHPVQLDSLYRQMKEGMQDELDSIRTQSVEDPDAIKKSSPKTDSTTSRSKLSTVGKLYKEP
jgi:hypothetical protein